MSTNKRTEKDFTTCLVIISCKNGESFEKFDDLVSYLFEGVCKMKGFVVDTETPVYAKTSVRYICHGLKDNVDAFKSEIDGVFLDIKTQFGDFDYQIQELNLPSRYQSLVDDI